NSSFIANQAQGGPRTSLGGALFSFLGSLSVSGCGFVHNVASSTRFAESGALDNEVCLATITNCSFVANQAVGSSGGSAAAGALTNLQSTMTLSNCTLIGNAAVGGDGANGVHRFGASNGGAILNYQGTLSVTNCALTRNVAQGGNNGQSGPNSGVGSALG